MKKIVIFVVLAIFCVTASPDISSAHTKRKKSAKSASIKPAPKKQITKKKAPPLSSEEQLRKDLISKLARTLSWDEVEKIFSDKRLFIDKTVLQTKPIECELPDGSRIQYTGYFDPNCGILITSSLRRGKSFIEKHQNIFDKAYELYGVDQEVIAAILRVETNFGSYLGSRSVLNTLYTQYILTPSRRSMALEQIEYFLKLAKRQGWEDLFLIKGSSWGAIGLPQFMPFSYWHFAVDCNEDKIVDLFDPADAICSAANYLRIHGWSDIGKSQRSAIWAYNHDSAYVNAVLAYMRSLKNFAD